MNDVDQDNPEFDQGEIHRLGMAGLGRNIGFGVNKVFAAPMLAALQMSPSLVGLVLGFEGLFGLILNPLTGWLSDRTGRQGWRRKAYLWVSFPGAALTWFAFYFAQTPWTATWLLVAFYFFQQLSVSPYLAWMPELVAPERRGAASGYLNLWWLVGNLIAFLVIPTFWSVVGHLSSFMLASFMILAGGLITALTVREPAVARVGRTGSGVGSGVGYGLLFRGDLIKYFLSQTLSWLSFEAIAAFFTLFVERRVGGTVFDSALGMSVFTVTGILTARFFGQSYHARPPRDFLAALCAFFGAVSLFGSMVQDLWWMFALLAVAGVFWGGIQVISYALASDLLHRDAQDERLEEQLRGGLYAGTAVVQSVGILIAAPLAGFAVRAAGGDYAVIFLVSGASSFGAAAILLAIRPMLAGGKSGGKKPWRRFRSGN